MHGYFVLDPTPIHVCHSKREHRRKAFKSVTAKGRSTMGWVFGFKFHQIINDPGWGFFAIADKSLIVNLLKQILGVYKYQKLHDYIFGNSDDERTKNTTDFLNRFFATEMNVNRAKRTKVASKDKLPDRKDNFFRTDYIQQFPVTILVCGDYITNNDEQREIDDIFGVTFDRKYPNTAAGRY